MSYWDTSALAKLYLPEPDTTTFVAHATLPQPLVTSRLALYEMRRVALRKESDGSIQPGAAQHVLGRVEQDAARGHLRVIELDARVAVEFDGLMKHAYGQQPALALRTLDGIHLASCPVDQQGELVATDVRLRQAAVLLGLKLFPA